MNSFSSASKKGSFNEETFHSSRRRHRWQAVFFALLGGVVLLDSGSPIPIPLTGLPSILLGSVIMAFGWYHWRAYQRLPLHEALQLGQAQGGQLSRMDLFLKLRLTSEQTDILLEQLVREGFIERVNDDLPPENEDIYRLLS